MTVHEHEDFELEEVGPETPESQAEAKDVKALIEEYDEARKFDEHAREQYVVDRGYASGQKIKNWASDANLIGSFIDILVAFLYARNPDVSARAAAQVGGVTKDNQSFAETATIVVSNLWKRARLKRAARKMVRSTLSVGVGWLKVIMNNETRQDPQVKSQLNDIADNIEALRATQQMIEDPENQMEVEELESKIAEYERLQVSLQNRLEVVHKYGVAVDFVKAEDMQVSLDVDDICDYLDADWNGNEMYVPAKTLTKRFPRLTEADVKHATVYHSQKPKTRAQKEEYAATGDSDSSQYVKGSKGGTGGDGCEFARIIEVWDNRDGHIKTVVEGIKKWAVEPYQPPYWTSRFYPYFLLALFETDGDRHPQSLAYRLKKLQDEYSSKRSNGRLTAERSVPGTIFNKGSLTSEDARKIENSTHMEMIGLNSPTGDDIRKLFTAKPVPAVDPLVFDTRQVISDMERLSGVQEALSQSIQTQKTATEAKIQDQGFNTRSSADRDMLEDLLNDLAVYTTELSIQAIPMEEAVRMAGPMAFWPEGMAPEDVVTLVELEIKAGSTGKPDKDGEQQNWTVILPLVQQIMMAIQNAQMMGNVPLAEAYRNLLAETFRRLDERVDVEQFIPQGMLPNMLGVPGIPGSEKGAENQEKPRETAADVNTLV